MEGRKEGRLNVVCSTDDKFAPYCGIMLTSLFENNHNVNVYVLSSERLSYKSRQKFSALSGRYPDNKICFIDVANELFCEAPVTPQWSVAMYYRLLCADLLPENLDTVLYLDCDIVVDGCIDDLFMVDMTDKSVAAVPDCNYWYPDFIQKRKYIGDSIYFNTGVMLINLKYWREKELAGTFLNYIKRHREELDCADQDVLNAVLVNSKTILNMKYNFQVRSLRKGMYEQCPVEMRNDIDLTRPLIIHYLGDEKPWYIINYEMPYRSLFYKYKRISPWRWNFLTAFPKHKTLNWTIKRYFLWPFGIMRLKYYIYPGNRQ